MSDYDPVKAHEYYEKNKQLKGKRSTKGFTQTQKEQFAYAKDQLREQYKEEVSSISDSVKQQKEMLTQLAKAKIESIRQQLKDRLKYMTPEEKKAAREAIGAAIGKIRESTASKKQSVSEKGKASKEKAKKQYEAAVDAAHADIKGEA